MWYFGETGSKQSETDLYKIYHVLQNKQKEKQKVIQKWGIYTGLRYDKQYKGSIAVKNFTIFGSVLDVTITSC